MALADIDPYPWFLNKSLDLVVNEQLVRTRITASEWADSWRPLLGRLHDLWLAHYPERYLIAIAGPPGAGKSVLAEQLHFMIERGLLHKDAHSIALPMDGFHYPNTYLNAHVRKLPDGREIPLSYLKGHPETIDVARLRQYLQAMIARPEYVMWPGYSRFVHDVVPDKFKVHMSINVVIVEGNYLLVNRGPFAGISDMFHLKIYVEAPAPKIIANLVDRHIHGGKTLEQAKEWVKQIDLPNARIAESSRHAADLIIERDTDDDIASLTWKGEAPLVGSKAGPEELASPNVLAADAEAHAVMANGVTGPVPRPLAPPAPHAAPTASPPAVAVPIPQGPPEPPR